MNKNIYIFGAGYVGFTLGALLAKHNSVTFIDINPEKVRKLNKGEMPITDGALEQFILRENINFNAITSFGHLDQPDIVFICTNTDFNDQKGCFDTSSVDDCIRECDKLFQGIEVIVRSTVPIGYTANTSCKYVNNKIGFAPEFLREGNGYFDSRFPARVILPDERPICTALLTSIIENENDCKIISMESSEAEASKLFANTFLASRVAFFNEVDSFCITQGLNAENVIRGIVYDPRIGEHYCNPSFGYGGYCLPKDTKQVISQTGPDFILINSIDKSNLKRAEIISRQLKTQKGKTLGVRDFSMKLGSDNFRSASIFTLLDDLIKDGHIILAFAKEINLQEYLTSKKIEFTDNLDHFLETVDLELVNRKNSLTLNKVYTRDVFNYG